MGTQSVKRNTAVSHPSTIDDLNDDLLSEILLRLPAAKYCFRCKAVSKRWHAIISSPDFGHCFVSHPTRIRTQNPFILFGQHIVFDKQDDECIPLDSLNFEEPVSITNFANFNYQQLTPVASCNDLVLCESRVHSDWLKIYENFYICNPFTKQGFWLPSLDHSGLIFGGSVGFICDENRFVIVYLFHMCSSEKAMWKFSSEIGRWTSSALLYPISRTNNMHHIAYNGRLYWIASQRGVVEYEPFLDSFEFFAFKSGSGVEIYVEDDLEHIGFCRGTLRLSRISRLDLTLRIWEFKKEWYLMHTFSFGDSFLYLPGNICHTYFHPRDGGIIYLSMYGAVVFLNLRQKTPVITEIWSKSSGCKSFSLVLQYWPTSLSSFIPKEE